MTQIASGTRGHQLDLSAYGSPCKVTTDVDLFLQGRSAPAARPAPALAGLAPAEPVLGGPAFASPGLADAEGGAEAEADVLSAVWRTSSYLETVQWELDRAQASLLQAVETAAQSGICHDELCRAANLTPEELAAALGDFAGEAPEIF